MRVPVICLAVLVIVFLALPETTGAPTKADSESYTRQEDKSKVVAKEGEEEEKYYESTSNANGLVSGTRVHSQDKHNTELEEEQSSSTEEIKTATGSMKTHKAKKQKQVVTSSEHKEVLVYFMVSYKALPKQRSGECRISYYKRIFPVEDNLKQFYHKIFKNYENEESTDYIERVEFILNNVYPEYDPRLDVKWLEEFDHYYTLKYSRKLDECDESYFPRVLAKESDESCEHYKKRMECLVAALDEEDFSHITFDDSELGYTIGVRTTTAKSTSGLTEGGQVSSQVSTSSVKSKEEEESVDENEITVETAGLSGSSTTQKREVKKKRTTVESEIHSKSSTFRMAYNKLPVRCDGESLTDYYIKYFGEYSLSTITTEAKDELLLRIFIQYRGESAEEYIKRVDYLFDYVYSEFDIRTDATFANLLTHYYRTKYCRHSSETDYQWFARVLKKHEGESAEQYKQRVTCLKTALTEVEWSKVTIDENSSEGYTLVSEGSASYARSVTRSISEEEIKKTYFRAEKEELTTYIGRITKQLFEIEYNEEFIDIVTVLWKEYPELSFWYDTKYYQLFNTYFKKTYEKTSVETEEDYHKRILTKQSYETDGIYVKRIEMLQKVFPTLSIWYDDKYYEKYMKSYYLSYYKKVDSEDEAAYYARLISKFNEESDFAFIIRLNLIRKTYPELSLWYDEKYYKLVEKYYESLYERKTLETKEAYYKRLFTMEAYETEETYFKRLQVLHKLFSSLSVWADDEYYEKYIKSYIQYVYKKSCSEDENTYYSRLVYKFDEESDEIYVNRLSFIKRAYPDLCLWYNSKYYDLVRKYYTFKYAKHSSETEDEYFKRVVAKESCECDETYVKRIQVVQQFYPTISLWSDEHYYKYTKQCYQIVYRQLETEDKETYFSRIVSRWEGESDLTYSARLTLIQSTYRCLPLWYSEKYFSLVKEYYTIKYVQLNGETDGIYIKRLTKKEKGDSTDSIYGKRIHLIHLATISSSVWYDDQYYDCCLKQYYESYYKKGDSEKCADWLKRVFTLLSGECESNAIKRIALIKKCTNYSCWTLEILSEIERYFSESYICNIKETYFSVSSYSSSSSSTKKSSSSSEESQEENVVVVARG